MTTTAPKINMIYYKRDFVPGPTHTIAPDPSSVRTIANHTIPLIQVHDPNQHDKEHKLIQEQLQHQSIVQNEIQHSIQGNHTTEYHLLLAVFICIFISIILIIIILVIQNKK